MCDWRDVLAASGDLFLATSLQEAGRWIARIRPSAIVIEIQSPILPSLEISRLARSAQPTVPIVAIVSSDISSQELMALVGTGVSDILEAPVAATVVLESLLYSLEVGVVCTKGPLASAVSGWSAH